MSKKWLQRAGEKSRANEKFNKSKAPAEREYRCSIATCERVMERRDGSIDPGWSSIGTTTDKLDVYCPGRHAFLGKMAWQMSCSFVEGEDAEGYDARMRANGWPIGVVEQARFVSDEADRMFGKEHEEDEQPPFDVSDVDEATPTAEKGVVPADGHPAWKPDYKAPKGTRERHESAYRMRAGMIGTLAMCICTWPLDVEPTMSGHSEHCPSDQVARKEAA